ncbi:methyltransferase domain-containing protein [Candidatus Poribacteria bacterium]|nr:methyltransferase domain-containing protein [Candidatus Poribacteria bacterium]
MSTPKYLYLTNIPKLHAELIRAECIALTGSVPNAEGIAISEKCVDVKRGAYVKSCVEILFEGGSVSEICSQIRSAELHAEDFRVSIVKLPRNLKVDSMQTARIVGGVIGGKVNLTQPQVVFLTVITNDKIWLGRRLSESDGKWVEHSKRPHTTSSSLPTRLARVMVNLIASPEDRLLDPCCGTGTIVLEAAQMGMKVAGYDINPRMVGATAKNLDYYGLSGEIHLGDARRICSQSDAVATDLPYGINMVQNILRDREILQNIRTLAPKAAFVDVRDLSKELIDLGYRVEKVIPVPKHSILRRIFLTATQ